MDTARPPYAMEMCATPCQCVSAICHQHTRNDTAPSLPEWHTSPCVRRASRGHDQRQWKLRAWTRLDHRTQWRCVPLHVNVFLPYVINIHATIPHPRCPSGTLPHAYDERAVAMTSASGNSEHGHGSTTVRNGDVCHSMSMCFCHMSSTYTQRYRTLAARVAHFPMRTTSEPWP